jgi:ribosome biogenesis GTPase / thiamine phosphate phosphatase
MRELGMMGAEAGIEEIFADISALARTCRYSDCLHDSEPGCEVRAAMARHEVSEEHFRNYRKLQRETAFHDQSYSDRRKKERAFGKLVRTIKKEKDARSRD